MSCRGNVIVKSKISSPISLSYTGSWIWWTNSCCQFVACCQSWLNQCWPCIYYDFTLHFKLFTLFLFYMRHEHVIFLLKKKIWIEILNDYCWLSLAIRESYCHPKMKIFIKSRKFWTQIFFIEWNLRNLNSQNFAICRLAKVSARESFCL